MDLTNINEIIGQAISIVCVILFALSYQVKEQKHIIIIQTFGTLGWCLAYYFIGATSGFAVNIVTIVRNISMLFIKPRTRLSYISTSILVVAMGVAAALAWEGPRTIIIVVSLIANTIFFSFGDPQLLRKSVIATSSGFLVYNIISMLSGGIISESMSIISSIIGIIRYRKLNRAVSNYKLRTSAYTEEDDENPIIPTDEDETV